MFDQGIATFTVWFYPVDSTTPSKAEGVADVAKYPDGVIRFHDVDGNLIERGGEIIRVRSDLLDAHERRHDTINAAH